MKGKLKETLRVTVTQEDWNKAAEEFKDKDNLRSQICPVSQALSRRFPECEIHTGLTSASIACKDSIAEYALGDGRAIVSAFDLKHPITLPVTFSLSRLA